LPLRHPVAVATGPEHLRARRGTGRIKVLCHLSLDADGKND
jgi:hypothetical protein